MRRCEPGRHCFQVEIRSCALLAIGVGAHAPGRGMLTVLEHAHAWVGMAHGARICYRRFLIASPPLIVRVGLIRG